MRTSGRHALDAGAEHGEYRRPLRRGRDRRKGDRGGKIDAGISRQQTVIRTDQEAAMGSVRTTCCIVGGGPAGVMLGYLLARAGVAVTVLEKHKDFFRDFRGDTVHPSTLELMYELDLLEDFLKVPHQQVTSVGGVFGDFAFQAADLRHVPTRCKFVALMPQWDFLNFLSSRAGNFPAFNLRMQHQAVGLLRDGGRVTGVE